MHFATADPGLFRFDGAIWQVDYAKTNRLLPEHLRALLEAEGSFTVTVEMLDRAAGSLEAFSRLAEREFVAFFEPPSMDERIVNQFALFSLMSRPTSGLGCWLRQQRAVARRIIIPAALKLEVRDKLDQANITERVLFPGLNGLSQYLKRYSIPRVD